MGWKQQIGAVERLFEVAAAVSLSAAVAFAFAAVVPLAGIALAAVAGLGASVAGVAVLAMLARIDPPGADGAPFAPVEFADALAPDELLLDEPIESTAPQVVSLFGAKPLAEPGAMIRRIADHLAAGGGAVPAQGHARPDSDEASAALHAALADIRRSLR